MASSRLIYYLIHETIRSKSSLNLCKSTWINVQRITTKASSDPYTVLGLRRDANETTVKNAYIKLSKKFHPDKNPGNEDAKEMFLKIQNSYREIMKNIQLEEPKPEDESDHMTKYSFTVSPLGVENMPPIPLHHREPIKWMIFFFLVIVCYIALEQIPRKVKSESKEEIIKQVTEQYKAEILEEEQEKREAADIKSEMRRTMSSFQK
uniref:Uncharacterized protein LOC100175116 n=1 Tax=Phallusia mammillata TaxID=59560 RepID=A0A6F9DG85_9ASCI|nr:uncharacterized protein LOC100175116 [Phallusia mammillata]